MQRLDPDSAEMLRLMVGYLTDDRKIAAHIGIDVKHVAAARKQRRRTREDLAASRQDTAAELPAESPDAWKQNIRLGSMRLAEALALARA